MKLLHYGWEKSYHLIQIFELFAFWKDSLVNT